MIEALHSCTARVVNAREAFSVVQMIIHKWKRLGTLNYKLYLTDVVFVEISTQLATGLLRGILPASCLATVLANQSTATKKNNKKNQNN